jgi:DNA-binding MarR family transcriptional regulator
VSRGPDPEIKAVDILRVFLSSPDPAFVPAEIADELGVTTEGARHQMNRLADRGLLEKKKPGSRTVLYWITEDGREYYFRETSQ